MSQRTQSKDKWPEIIDILVFFKAMDQLTKYELLILNGLPDVVNQLSNYSVLKHDNHFQFVRYTKKDMVNVINFILLLYFITSI